MRGPGLEGGRREAELARGEPRDGGETSPLCSAARVQRADPQAAGVAVAFFSSRRRHTRLSCDWSFRRVLFQSRLTCGTAPVVRAGEASCSIEIAGETS